MKKLAKLLITIILFSTPTIALANFQGDLSITKETIQFSDNYLLEGKNVKIYATVSNNSNQDLLGTVKFINQNTNKQISNDQPISLFSQKTDDVFIDWTPNAQGQYTIKVQIQAWAPEIDDPTNNETSIIVNVYKDTDRDGLADKDDPDDDNDEILDENDIFPLDKNEWEDTDEDTIGNNADDDDDNDGCLDSDDDLPLDPLECKDTDLDGIGDNIDDDDDNDNLTDTREAEIGTNPKNKDTDNDGIQDDIDPFPLDSSEWRDFDNDKIGNNADDDDDNDGILDTEDFDSENKGPLIILKKKPTLVRINTPIALDVSDSYDEDGNIVKFSWEINCIHEELNTPKGFVQKGNEQDLQMECKTKEGNTISETFFKTGKQTLKITAIDNKGESRSMLLTINVIDYLFYLRISLFLLLIALALVIIFKYTRVAKKSKNRQAKSRHNTKQS